MSTPWIVVDVSAGRSRGPAQVLWPLAGWHEWDTRSVGPAGPGATIMLTAGPAGPFRVERGGSRSAG